MINKAMECLLCNIFYQAVMSPNVLSASTRKERVRKIYEQKTSSEHFERKNREGVVLMLFFRGVKNEPGSTPESD